MTYLDWFTKAVVTLTGALFLLNVVFNYFEMKKKIVMLENERRALGQALDAARKKLSERTP